MNPLADNCPRCPAAVTVAPYSGHADGQSTVTHYECPACGHRWSTSRLLTAEELAGAA